MGSNCFVKILEDVGSQVVEGADVKLKQEHQFDVVVVGGGTSGCALAARLSEDQNIRVLLLEAGRSGVALPASRAPAGFLGMLRTDDCFNFYTEPQIEAGGGRKYWPRAKLLGGCSSINAMMFQVGAPSDFDEWAKLGGPGAEMWKWSEIEKYFKKFEKYTPSKRFPDVDPSLRGSDGPMEIGYSSGFSKVSESFIEACREIGIPYIPDINTSAGCIGTSKIMTFVTSKGRRVSTESGYLTPDAMARPNLTIAIEATVTRILFDTSGEAPRADGVEFARTKDGPKYRVGVRKEVVVCGGAIGSPTVLMHSGIGPAAELANHSIPVVVDLPGVGTHLQDHVLVNTRFRAKPSCESVSYLASRTLAEKAKTLVAQVRYFLFGTGPLSCNLGEAVAFVRSSDPKLFPIEEGYGTIEDSTSGPMAPDIEIFSTPAAWKDHGFGSLPPGQLFSITEYLVRPTSYGTITLRSADPFDAPIIDPKYLSTRHDVDVLVRGLRFITRLMRTRSLAPMIAPDDNPALDLELHKADDAKLEQIVRERLETAYHPTSSARMGTRESGGVIDAELKVHGVKGLRVCDASIFPSMISGHTSAACIAAAEKAADIMKAALSSK